ncbi:hypothetical protein MUK70_03440 [Dyadobacter chenwenxiniae]|uniref:Lipoprotein n=1 Tax=Dyadobacter chenwenxiniae TaxID=2906456 RepID=A0A9X1PRQ8_9BACT|nr:hypothetical protein [Dyadobacter chenwenxiniae]MCF0065798.1 hypothetical protein [Dyadobacter chenwenxiniae]UON84046.1 hypothetical protein MUK70_03440 [Dyadobacter chenwenxiniae]
MKFLVKTIFYTCFLSLIGCKEKKDPQRAQCGCDSDAEAIINNISGKIEYDTTEQPISYRLQGYYSTGLAVCNDSTFQTLLAQNKIMNGDSVVFGGEAKNTCTDCEFCGLISITTLAKK